MKIKVFIILLVVLGAILFIFQQPPIPQDTSYHEFADQRSLFGLPNYLNIFSNLPYFVFGLIGLLYLIKESQLKIVHSLKHIYATFFISVSLVSFGSSYYHLNPSNETLLWDRLPMALAFMSFFVVIIGEYIHQKFARKFFVPLLVTGAGSVIYWYWSETIGEGDLRLYIAVQFIPVLLIPLIMYLFKPKFTHGYYFLLIIACYVLAKAFELADQMMFDLLGGLSGHSIKHLVSSMAPFLFYLALKKRMSVIDRGLKVI